MVDEKKIAFNPAYELSFLTKEEQAQLVETMDYEQLLRLSPRHAKATENRQKEVCTWDKIISAGKLTRRVGSAIYFRANFGYNVSTKGMIP